MTGIIFMALTRVTDSFANLSVVTLENTELRSFPVSKAGNGEFRVGIPVSRSVGLVDAYPAARRVYASPDGRRIAVLIRGHSGYEVLLLASKNLTPLASRQLPNFADLRWAPDSDHLVYQPVDGKPGGVISVSSTTRYALSLRSGVLAWSKAGDELFVPRDNLQSGGSDEGWWRYNTCTGKKTLVTFENVRRRSWLSVAKPGGPSLWLGNALLIWTIHGVFSPFFKSDHTLFAIDVALDRAGTHVLKRPGIINTASSQLYSSIRRIYYIQDYHLFDERDSPDSTVWLGVWDPTMGSYEQVHLFVGNDRTRLALQLTRTE